MEQMPTHEQLQWISNLAHWIEGGIFGIVAVIALLQAFGYARTGFLRYMWQGLILVAGAFLPFYLLLQRGFDQAGESLRFVIGDQQQREHVFMSLLLLSAGAAETLLAANLIRGRGWRFVAPTALVLIGVILIFHTEYGTAEAIAESVTQHRYQGILVILVGLFKAAQVLWSRKFRWLEFIWVFLLFGAAVLLISYREPEGAYKTNVTRHTQISATAVFVGGSSH